MRSLITMWTMVAPFGRRRNASLQATWMNRGRSMAADAALAGSSGYRANQAFGIAASINLPVTRATTMRRSSTCGAHALVLPVPSCAWDSPKTPAAARSWTGAAPQTGRLPRRFVANFVALRSKSVTFCRSPLFLRLPEIILLGTCRTRGPQTHPNLKEIRWLKVLFPNPH